MSTRETSSEQLSETDRLKQAAAVESATRLENGMIVGLGSGTTAKLAVDAIGKRVKEGLQIVGIPTSEKTAEQARGLGIPLSTLEEYSQIDVTIDGADEVELGTLNLIKGGGGNLLREKIVAAASLRLLIVVDDRKVVGQLGSHAVPVEVAQFGWKATSRRLEELKAKPTLRMSSEGKAFVTDGGNYILDCLFGPIASAAALAIQLDSVVGVMEHGLFVGMAEQVLVGGQEGVKRLERTT